MQLLALRYFNTTAKVGSIRKAAEALHVAPSAISRQIINLEHDLGAPLFERTSQGMRLTAAGELLARQTQRTFRDLDRIRSAVDDLRGLRRGHVTAYVIEGLVSDFLPRIFVEFHDRYPDITFTINTAATDRIIDALVRDEADLGIAFNAPSRPDVVHLVELVEPLNCLLALDHPLAGRSTVSLEEILAYPVALPDAAFGIRQMIDAAIAQEKFAPTILLTTNSLEFAKTLAMTGRAIAFMPPVTVASDIGQGRLASVRVTTPLFASARTSLCVHRDRDLPFAAKAFVSFVGEKLQAVSPGK